MWQMPDATERVTRPRFSLPQGRVSHKTSGHLCETQMTGLFFSPHAAASFLNLRISPVNGTASPRGQEAPCLKVHHQWGWGDLGSQDSSGSLWFVIKRGFGQTCPYFFRMKRIWAVTFINGKTVILSSPRRNFWPSRKHSSQERKDCHWTE